MQIEENKRNVPPAERQNEAAAENAVCGLNALLAAETRTHRHVGYKNSVSRFHMLTMSKCKELCDELQNRTYKPQKGEPHEVFEPKYRITVSSKYRDRIPQSSFITNYFYPHVVPELYAYNCACMKGKGVDYAREAFKSVLRRANPTDYCLCADMKSYFASIDHEKLYEELFTYITDDYARWFFVKTVENASKPIGLDLGSEVYQLSATSFPNRLDHQLGGELMYIRYQDDIRLVGAKEKCVSALETIKRECERLGLRISEKKTYIQPISRPIRFLGFSFLRHNTGRITLKRFPEKIRRERRKLKRMKQKGIPEERVDEHYQSARACLKKGARSDLCKMDRYKKSIFGG